MAKLVTPQMEKINRRYLKSDGTRKSTSPGREAWSRLIRNKTAVVGMFLIIIILLTAVFADLIAPYDPTEQDYTAISKWPSPEHIFGTDKIGRDLFSRCVYGARYSIPIALLAISASLCIGGLLGFIAGYCGGRVDNVIMRIADIFQAIPGVLLAIAIVATLGNGIPILIFAMSIGALPSCARTCRGAILTVRTNEYIESTRAIGAGNIRVLFRHMLPNAVGPIIIFVVGMTSITILQIAALSYIGVGIAPPTPEWGTLLSYGRDNLQSHPYMVWFPGLMIIISVFGFNLFGDGLRDALDPRLK